MHTTMGTRTKSFPIPPLMLASIKRWADLAGTSDSEVIRVAVEIGLRALQEDPSPLLGRDLGPPPSMTPVSAPSPSGGSSGADRVRAELDSDITPRSLNAVRGELERMREEKKKRKGPPPSKG